MSSGRAPGTDNMNNVIDVDTILEEAKREADDEKFGQTQFSGMQGGFFPPQSKHTRDTKREQPGTASRIDPNIIIPQPTIYSYKKG